MNISTQPIELLTPAKARAIAGIMDNLTSGCDLSRQYEINFEQFAKQCTVCGCEFSGNYKITVCSSACRDRRNRQRKKNAERMRRGRV